MSEGTTTEKYPDEDGVPEDSTLISEPAAGDGVAAGAAVPGAASVLQAGVATEPKIVVSSRVTAIASLIVAASCLTALVIVATLKNADGLATIALALAVIAFAVQLLSTAAQNQVFSQQSLRAEQLNTETRALLTEMQTTARGTERMVREQFGQLLRAFMDAAKPEKDKQGDPEDFEARLVRNIARDAALSAPDVVVSEAARAQARQRQAQLTARQKERQQARKKLEQPYPPEEEVAPILSQVRELTPSARARLRSYALDDTWASISKDPDRYAGISVDDAQAKVDRELLDRKFVELVREPNAPEPKLVYRLTDSGRLAARIVTAVGPVPEWAVGIVTGDSDADGE